jgi:hypothetical protein
LASDWSRAQLHHTDPSVPLAESLGALRDLKTQGKIQHVGLCNVDAAQIRRKIGRISMPRFRGSRSQRRGFSPPSGKRDMSHVA